MATTQHHLNRRDARLRPGVIRLAAVAVGLALPIVAAFPTLAGDGSAAAADTNRLAYGWPVKPFDRPHPVRGSFGDPRTVFLAPPTTATVLRGAGTFSFHQGIDIAAPNGTAVYPVASGLVERVTNEWVRVDCGDGRKFEYWHIRAIVREGQKVEAGKTILGGVKTPAEHVHLTELRDGQPVNPLAPGHLRPYRDRTKPRVASIAFRRSETGADLMPSFLRGRVVMLAEAYDTPSLRVPGAWNGLPVTPAVVSWRIQRWQGKVVVGTQAAEDVRSTVPPNSSFWRVYARGSYQNMAVFGRHYSFLQRGCFLFKLTPEPFDTRRLHDGVYDLVVTATDIAGNSSSLSRRFTVHNRAGWIGS
jgi:hypothetical protein